MRPTLKLVVERPLVELVATPGRLGVLDASGVVAKGRDFFLIFGNVRRIARIDRESAWWSRFSLPHSS